jgi:pantetheine-phosphate adenylyltransferase
MKRAIIYPGSFNPFTIGHQNILEKAEKIFQGDRVMIAVGINNAKHKSLSIEQMEEIKDAKVKTVKGQLPSKEVVGYVGFLTDFVREIESQGYDEVVVVRGLRNGYDLDYEYTTARYMWDQYPHLSIICIMCDPIFAHVSSSGYRANEEVVAGSGHKYLAIDRPNTIIKNNGK